MKRTYKTDIATVYNGNYEGIKIACPRNRITEDQAYELTHALARIHLPQNGCCTAITTNFRTGYQIFTYTNYDKPSEITQTPITEEGFEATLYLGFGRKCTNCLHSLSRGKCTDKYVRKYIGAILYPQHYAKYKQK